jgi:hypothetical protein
MHIAKTIEIIRVMADKLLCALTHKYGCKFYFHRLLSLFPRKIVKTDTE